MKALLILVVIGVLLSPVFIYRAIKLSTIHYETITVTKKPDRTIEKNADGSSNTYAKLIYTNHGVYINHDSVFPWKTRSSDVYDQLEVGKTYHCEIAGWRIGFFSAYKNIITCDGFKYD